MTVSNGLGRQLPPSDEAFKVRSYVNTKPSSLSIYVAYPKSGSMRDEAGQSELTCREYLDIVDAMM